MSPEQVEGKSSDRRSDIFSSGLVMYELLSYHQAFPGDTITCTGTVRGCTMHSGEHVIELDVAARNQDDVTLLTGKARVAWP